MMILVVVFSLVLPFVVMLLSLPMLSVLLPTLIWFPFYSNSSNHLLLYSPSANRRFNSQRSFRRLVFSISIDTVLFASTFF